MKKKTIMLWLLCLFTGMPMGVTADTMEYTLSFSPSDYEYIYVGRNVTTRKPIGNVAVGYGKTISLKAQKGVYIKNGFTNPLGSTFEIDIDRAE